MAQKARGAGESCCFFWRHGGVRPGSQRRIRPHGIAEGKGTEGVDYESERHQKSYSRKPGFTETRLRPLARRREITFLPPWVFMRVRKPCFLLRLRRLGWNVRLGMKDSCS